MVKVLFLLHSTYTGDAPFQIRLNLDKFLAQSKITRFDIRYSQISQILYENPTFLLGKLYQKILFVLYSNYTGDTPCQVWLDFDNSLKRWKVTEHSVAVPFFQVVPNARSVIVSWRVHQKHSK